MTRPPTHHRTLWLIWAVVTATVLFIPDPFYRGFVFGAFLSPELLAVFNRIRGDTFTEFIQWTVTDRISRFTIGVAYAYLALVAFPAPVAPWAAGFLVAWLPAHFAFPEFERRILDRLGELL